MSQELEIALLGASFGAILMPMLFLLSGLALGYLRENHDLSGDDILRSD